MPLFHRLLIVLGVVVVIGTIAFLVAWHYVLSAEVLDHPADIQVTHDTQVSDGVCGDGKIDPHEECDDGNDIPYDGCTRCLVDAFFTCGGEPSFCVRLAAGLEGCGNGKLEKGEECDDGNGLDGDGCSYRCEVEPGYMCNGAGPCRHRPPCGDGIIEEGEQCDDGNTTDYDGCNAACQVDHYYTCVGQPSVCTPTIIGSSSSSAEEVQTPNTPVAADASSSAVSFIYTPASSSSASSAYSLSPRRRHYSSVP